MHNPNQTPDDLLRDAGPGQGLPAYSAEKLIRMKSAIRKDRLWFQRNPSAIVRFRSASDGEFTPVRAMGATPPSFRPSFCRANAPLRWVAVVDLMRLAGSTSTHPKEPTARLRLQIPAIRSAERQQKAKAEILDAVASELLELLESEQTPLAA